MQYLKIENFTSSIHYGPHIKACEEGDVRYLISSHFNQQFELTNFKNSFIPNTEKNRKHLLQENDVLLTGKGSRLFAWAYTKDQGKVVPSSLFFVLRINSDVMIGEFLAEILNSEKLQHKLYEIAGGGTTLSISKSELKKITVLVPPMNEQRKMVDASKNLNENIELASKLLAQKRLLKKGVINQFINLQTSKM